ncbi:MAG: hypothetical protein IKS26_00025, partial [Paludibacteraceae bacterium]|nr:hypothetical protein [Paludibacteraceae bacterium]
AVQRYDEHLGFCKFFGKKMQEKCIFVEFWAKNDDYLERIAHYLHYRTIFGSAKLQNCRIAQENVFMSKKKS